MQAWLLHWPAWLLVAGGALAIALYLGEAARGGSVSVGLSCAGLVGALLGLAAACHAFAASSIEALVAGLTLAIASSYAALVGLAAVGLPREDRALASAPNQEDLAPSRLAWYGFPALVLVVLPEVRRRDADHQRDPRTRRDHDHPRAPPQEEGHRDQSPANPNLVA